MQATYFRQKPTGPMSENIRLESSIGRDSNLLTAGLYSPILYLAGFASESMGPPKAHQVYFAIARDTYGSAEPVTVRVLEFNLDPAANTFRSVAPSNSQVAEVCKCRDSGLVFTGHHLDIPTSDIYHAFLLCPGRLNDGACKLSLPGIGEKKSPSWYSDTVNQAKSCVLLLSKELTVCVS